jgi:hypothetical protein
VALAHSSIRISRVEKGALAQIFSANAAAVQLNSNAALAHSIGNSIEIN